MCSNNVENVPTPYGILTTIHNENVMRVQRYVDTNSAIWFRQYSGGAWRDWTRCDNFGYNDLSSLASALGGFQRLEYISDADTLGLGVYHSSFTNWDVTNVIDTGIPANSQTLLLLFRCVTSTDDSAFYSFIIPITVGSLKANIWRGDTISIKENESYPTSAIQFSVSNNNTINITGVFGVVNVTAIATI